MKEENRDEVLDWLHFLENPKSGRVTKKMEENEELKEAVEKLDTLSADEKMRRIAELREKAIYAKGIEVGEDPGELNKSKEITKNMIKKKMKIEDIIDITGLSKEQIEKL